MADLLSIEQLTRATRLKRWATAAGLIGAGLSSTANIMASELTAGAVLFAAVAPVAFAITAEMFSVAAGLPTNRLMKAGTWVMAGVALAAAVVSFGHIRSVVLGFGESELAGVLIPLVIDAMVLLGLAYHHGTADLLRRHSTASTAEAQAEAEKAEADAKRAADREATRKAKEAAKASKPAPTSADATADIVRQLTTATQPNLAGMDADDESKTVAVSKGDEIRALAAEQPDLTQAQLAKLAGCSARTVRRHLNDEVAA